MAKNCLVFITVLIGQAEGLPNITGKFNFRFTGAGNALENQKNGAFWVSGANSGYSRRCIGWQEGDNNTPKLIDANTPINFNASLANGIYGNSNHVTPCNATLKVWQRVS